MATHVSRTGTLKYQALGGYVLFPGDIYTHIDSKPVKTKDGRGIKYVEHTLRVNGWIFAADLANVAGTTDAAFAQARKILSQPGGILTIEGIGFGNYYINRDSGSGRDLKFGPFPDVVTWDTFGAVTCKFEWIVVFTLPWRDGVGTQPSILDYSWETEYSYDAEGFCDRSITAELEIAGTRYGVGNPQIPTVAAVEEMIRDNIVISCPTGMHRVGHNVKVNDSKTHATITVRDEQNRGYHYPPGISRMSIRHEMSTRAQGMTLASWVWTFTASATPDARQPSSHGFNAVTDAHRQRLIFLFRNLVNSYGSITPLPIGISISEDCNTRTTTLTTSWMLTVTGNKQAGTTMPQDILYRSGMWQPFDWTARDHKQLADSPLGPNNIGGYAQMVSDNRENIVLDVSGLAPRIPDPGKANGNYKIERPPRLDDLIQAPYGAYIEFKVWLQCLVEGGKWINYPLTNNGVGNQNGGAGQKFFQDITKNYNQYKLTGIICRVGIPAADIPDVKAIGRMKVTEMKKHVDTRPVMHAGMIVWRTEFVIDIWPQFPDNSSPVKAVVDQKKPRAVGKNEVRDIDGNVITVPAVVFPE